MSRLHRLRRRAGPAAITHDRARSLAATRVDWPLDPKDAAWLDAHLASCESCRSVAAAYGADRLALRSLRNQQPEPPRDLWARTAAAIEGESASRRQLTTRSFDQPALDPARRPVGDRGRRRRHRCQRPVGRVPHAGARATRKGGNPPIAVVPTAGTPGATPMAVGAGSVEWLGTSSTGGLAYSSTKIDKVCPTDRQPDCEPVNDRDSKQVALSIRPKSISQSPVKNQAVVVGTDAAGSDSVVVDVPSDTATDLDAGPVVDAGGDRDPEPHPRADRDAGRLGIGRGELRTVRVRLDRAECDAGGHTARLGRAIGRTISRTDAGSDPDPHARTHLVDQPGDHLRGQGRRPVGGVFARRCLVRVHRAPVGRLGRPGYLRLARRRPARRGGHE